MIVDAKIQSDKDTQALGNRRHECSTESLESFHDVMVSKPWGSEYLLFENSDVAIWILKIQPGQKTSMHCHPKKNTSLIVLGGNAHCRTLEQNYDFTQGQGIYIGKGVFHQSQNLSEAPLMMMEIESPVDKFDLVRLEDGYGRIDCGYESSAACNRVSGLTYANNLKGFPAQVCTIGSASITIGHTETFSDLEHLLSGLEHTVLSVLDRHVWTSEGKKFYEVGEAFRLEDHLSRETFKINTGFHYLLISDIKE